jgi:hypothetical protein
MRRWRCRPEIACGWSIYAAYVLRPPIAQERLERAPDGAVLMRLRRSWRDGTRVIRFEPSEFLEKLAAMDGRTHLAYKAQHALDVESELLVAAVIYRGDDADAETLRVTIELAREQLQAAEAPQQVEEVVADKGYHKAETLQVVHEVQSVRTYIPEQTYRGRQRWQDKPAAQQAIVYANRRRVRGRRGRQLGRWRSERVERSFAHTCETGGGRRTWLRGVVNVSPSSCWRCSGSEPRAVCRRDSQCFSPASCCCGDFS